MPVSMCLVMVLFVSVLYQFQCSFKNWRNCIRGEPGYGNITFTRVLDDPTMITATIKFIEQYCTII